MPKAKPVKQEYPFLRRYSGPLTEGRRFARGSTCTVRTPKSKPGGTALHLWQIRQLQDRGFIGSPPVTDGAPAADTPDDPDSE